MGISRIEVAIECDDPLSEGMAALTAMLRSLGLTVGDIETDVEVMLTSTEIGTPVVVAVVQKSDDESDNHE